MLWIFIDDSNKFRVYDELVQEVGNLSCFRCHCIAAIYNLKYVHNLSFNLLYFDAQISHERRAWPIISIIILRKFCIIFVFVWGCTFIKARFIWSLNLIEDGK